MLNNSRNNLCCQKIIYSGRGVHLWQHVCKGLEETDEYINHNLRQKFQNQQFLQNVIKVKRRKKITRTVN